MDSDSGLVWKDASEHEKRDFEELGRRGSGWYRLDPSEFPRLVGGYRNVAEYGVAVVEGSTGRTGTRSDCTVVTFVGNRSDAKDGAVDQETWVTAIHSTGMHTKVAEAQHADYDGRTRPVGPDLLDELDADTRRLDMLPLKRDRGPLREIEGTVYETVLEHIRGAATSASSDW